MERAKEMTSAAKRTLSGSVWLKVSVRAWLAVAVTYPSGTREATQTAPLPYFPLPMSSISQTSLSSATPKLSPELSYPYVWQSASMMAIASRAVRARERVVHIRSP
jgi:hypothetical protein